MKLDLHIHSDHSKDASGSPKDVLRYCKRAGLDGIAITDHNAIDGSLEAYAMAKAEGVIVVRGVEVSTSEGHVLAYGVGELIPRGLPVAETIEKIHASGGVCAAAHPKRFPSGIGLELARSGMFDAIEIINSGSSRGSNRLARRLAEEKGSAVTAGSDAHSVEQLGRAYTVVEHIGSEDEVIEAIRKRMTSAGGRSRTSAEGVRYSWETLVEWLRGDFRRL
jgi:predicted metal-dependent phosphoesterase TrpH